jgi:hypothetical protein
VCKDDEVWIGGKVNVTVGGDAKISVSGQTDITSTKTLTVTSPDIKLYANNISLNS